MKIVVAVIVYDRVDNIKKWIKCWKQADTANAELVIIHNNNGLEQQMKTICMQNSVRYISRKNIGYDIGALQDVANNRLPGFPEFNYLLWCTDDVLPMRKDFIKYFLPTVEYGAVTCMEISKEVRPHIRTTGFCITRQLLAHIKFPADPITTKDHCYAFEHRSQNTLLNQVEKLSAVRQVADIEQSPLWDTGHKSKAALRRFTRREQEFNTIWDLKSVHIQGNKVTVVCPIFNSFPEIISSMINQTHKNWELWLVHDGPNSTGLRKLVAEINDFRIKYSETEQRAGDWGHSIRSWALKQELGDYVVITNADNHHVPTYLEYMLRGFRNGTIATYCSHMVHNYKAHQVIPCSLERGFVDCAGVMVKSDIAKTVGWNNIKDHSADWLYFVDIAKHYGWQRFTKVEGCLLIHN